MISEVVMPQMGADMTEGTLLRWLKAEGDTVTRGEVIAEIETDKANVEIEAFEAGVFRTALAREGDVVQVGEVIAVIAGAGEDISKYGDGVGGGERRDEGRTQTAKEKQQTPNGKQQGAGAVSGSDAGRPSPAVARGANSAATDQSTAGAPVDPSVRPGSAALTSQPTPVSDTPPTPPAPPPLPAPRETAPGRADAAAGRVRASPLARKIAGERGIDLGGVHGSGPDGRIIRRDIESASAIAGRASSTAAAPAPDTVVTPTKMRQAIARRMSQSKREAPHYYLLVDVDMTDALAFRSALNEAVGEAAKVTVNDLVVRACALALQRHPQFNATIEGEQVTRHGEQHICIGVALEDGLIAPAIVGAGRMTLVQIGAAARDLIDRAKNGRMRAEELSAGTFTISNLGAFGIETLIAIIQPPQTAVLGVGSAAGKPTARDGAVVIREMMKLALSADHRVTDGAQGAQFLAEIKRLLEKPLLLVL